MPLLGHAACRLSQRELHLFVLVDVSGSMAPDGKMQSLNTAVEEALPHLRRVAVDAAGVSVVIRVVTFGSRARWTAEPEAIGSFAWDELRSEDGGLTELGAAVDLVLAAIHELPVASLVPPALLLVSDGMPTDVTEPSFDEAMRRLEADPLATAATRMAVGIGRDVDMASLRRFLGPRGGDPVRADSPQQLMVQLRDRVSAVVQSASELA